MKYIKSKNRNQNADETLDNSLWLPNVSITNSGVDEGMICQKSLKNWHPTDSFVINVYLFVVVW